MAKPAFLIALLLLGCQQEPPAAPAPRAEKLSDGSLFSREETEFTETAKRCWQGQRCLIVERARGLPANVRFFVAAKPAPYLCSTDHGAAYESISNTKGETVTSRRSGGLSGKFPWTAAEVRKLTTANSGGPFYFDCLSIAERIEAGSLATLGSSLITQRDLPAWP